MPPNTELTEEQRSKLAREGETLREAEELLAEKERAAAGFRLPETPPSAATVDSRPTPSVDAEGGLLHKPDAKAAERVIELTESEKREALELLVRDGVDALAKRFKGDPNKLNEILQAIIPGEQQETK